MDGSLTRPFHPIHWDVLRINLTANTSASWTERDDVVGDGVGGGGVGGRGDEFGGWLS